MDLSMTEEQQKTLQSIVDDKEYSPLVRMAILTALQIILMKDHERAHACAAILSVINDAVMAPELIQQASRLN